MQAIEPFDIVVIVLMIGMTIRGGLSGIVGQIMSIMSILLSWYIASRHFDLISGYLPKGNSWNEPVSIFVMFVLCNVVIRVATLFVQRIVKFGPLKEFDRQLGALLGLVKGLILCLVITFFAVTLSVKSRDAVASSQSGKYLVSTLMHISQLVPDDTKHASFKKELAKFATIVNDSGMATTSVADDIANLKQKLKKTVISPEAEKQLAQEKSSGAQTKTAVSNTKDKPAPVSDGSNMSSGMAGIDQFFSSLTLPRTSNKTESNIQTANVAHSGNVTGLPQGEATHPLESLASNFSGFSGNISLGDATVSVNVPGQGSGLPFVTDVRYPDLDAEISRVPVTGSFTVPLTSSGTTRTLSPATGGSVSVPTGTNNANISQGRENISFQGGERIYSGSIMYQPTFSPSSVAPVIRQEQLY